MKRSHLPLTALVLLLATTLFASPGLQQASAAPPSSTRVAHAVVRLPSHGASATIIETAKGRTVLLGCGHAFQGSDRKKPIVVDISTTQAHPPQKVGVRLVAVDYDLDLSLVVLDSGPAEFVVPVAGPGHVAGAHLLSVGYDEMRWPATERSAHVAITTALVTYTWERPWHGRSGGALLDLDNQCLIGVVQGYEVTGQRRGMYVSHAAILRFLARYRRPERDWPLELGDSGLGEITPRPERRAPRPEYPWPACPT